VQEFLALEYFARLPDGHPARLPLIIRSKNRSADHCHLNDKVNSPEESTRWPNDPSQGWSDYGLGCTYP